MDKRTFIREINKVKKAFEKANDLQDEFLEKLSGEVRYHGHFSVDDIFPNGNVDSLESQLMDYMGYNDTQYTADELYEKFKSSLA